MDKAPNGQISLSKFILKLQAIEKAYPDINIFVDYGNPLPEDTEAYAMHITMEMKPAEKKETKVLRIPVPADSPKVYTNLKYSTPLVDAKGNVIPTAKKAVVLQ